MTMAKMTTQELLSVFEEMTVLELKDFLDAFEERFEVTAAAPMAVAAAPWLGVTVRPPPSKRRRTSSMSSSPPSATRRSR